METTGLVKAYIGSDSSEVRYYINKNFKDITFYNTEELSFDSFCSMNRRGLISSKGIKCFLGVEKYGVKQLGSVIDTVDSNIIWSFKKLAKNTNIYKRLKEDNILEEVKSFSDKRTKNSFVKRLIKEYKIPDRYFQKINKFLPNNRQAIDNELIKFKFALETLQEEDAFKVLINFPSDKDIFNFIPVLFNDKAEALFYADRIEKLYHERQLNALLKKYFTFMLYLSVNQVDKATQFWNIRGYYLNEATNLACKIGFDNILCILKYLSELFEDIYNSKPYLLKLKMLIRFINNKEYENYYSRN